MRKFYNKLFKIDTNEHISDKKMLARVVSTVVFVGICLMMMSLSAFSYFSLSIKSGTNTLTEKQSSFKVNVEVVNNADSTAVSPNAPKPNAYADDFNLTNSGGTGFEEKVYKVTLTMNGNTDVDTGFCKIMIGDKNGLAPASALNGTNGNTTGTLVFETPQFGNNIIEDNNTLNRDTFTFYIKIPATVEATATNVITLRVFSSWGTSINTDSAFKLADHNTITINTRTQNQSTTTWSISK